LKALNFTDVQTSEMMSLLAGLLHLGNVQYDRKEELTTEGSQLRDESSKKWMKSASELLSVDADEMELWTTKDQTSVRGHASTILKHLNVLDAVGARDSTAKSVYSKLFDWLVKHINDVCLPSSASSRQKNFIGLLDIFGFERFTSNGEFFFFFFFL